MLWLVWQYFLSLFDVKVLLPCMDVGSNSENVACEARAYLLRQLWTVAQRIVLTVAV